MLKAFEAQILKSSDLMREPETSFFNKLKSIKIHQSSNSAKSAEITVFLLERFPQCGKDAIVKARLLPDQKYNYALYVAVPGKPFWVSFLV